MEQPVVVRHDVDGAEPSDPAGHGSVQVCWAEDGV